MGRLGVGAGHPNILDGHCILHLVGWRERVYQKMVGTLKGALGLRGVCGHPGAPRFPHVSHEEPSSERPFHLAAVAAAGSDQSLAGRRLLEGTHAGLNNEMAQVVSYHLFSCILHAESSCWPGNDFDCLSTPNLPGKCIYCRRMLRDNLCQNRESSLACVFTRSNRSFQSQRPRVFESLCPAPLSLCRKMGVPRTTAGPTQFSHREIDHLFPCLYLYLHLYLLSFHHSIFPSK
jgi:hypothetical protein